MIFSIVKNYSYLNESTVFPFTDFLAGNTPAKTLIEILNTIQNTTSGNVKENTSNAFSFIIFSIIRFPTVPTVYAPQHRLLQQLNQ